MDIPWQADLCVMMCWRVGQQRPKSDQIDNGTTQKIGSLEKTCGLGIDFR